MKTTILALVALTVSASAAITIPLDGVEKRPSIPKLKNKQAQDWFEYRRPGWNPRHPQPIPQPPVCPPVVPPCVPEPSTAILGLMGAALLLIRKR